MFSLGFTMEELMFPENYPSSALFKMEHECLIDKTDELTTVDGNQGQRIMDNDNDDDDDDWFTIQQLNPEISSNRASSCLIHDQTLPLFHTYSDKYCYGQLKPVAEMDGTLMMLHLPNLSIKLAREKNSSSSSCSSDTIPSHLLLPNYEPVPLHVSTTFCQRQPNKHAMSKSSSSLSFSTQSSTSLTSSSADETSPKPTFHCRVGRRRRKRTIFSAADIEHLKEAFIQNPKPSQQDIAILSEQLGHDSYVIRVWFYNKRQATKKRTG